MASILMFKYVALLMAISAMVVLMAIENTGASLIESSVFMVFTLLASAMIVLVFRGIRSTHLG